MALKKKNTPIVLVPDPDQSDPLCKENCCFCFRKSWWWVREKDVCCCEACAATHTLEEVPSKEKWIESVQARFNPKTGFIRIKGQDDLSYARDCIALSLKGGGDAARTVASIELLIRAILAESAA